MKLPNQYGSVYKLSGKRRKPWVARKTVGWKTIPEKQKAYPIYNFIGYYTTKTDALQALADYNTDPMSLNRSTMTFADVYQKWAEEHKEKVTEGTMKTYTTAYNHCIPIYKMVMQDIKLDHLQTMFDESGLPSSVLDNVKIVLNMVWDYAVMHEIVPKNKREMLDYLNSDKGTESKKVVRESFTKDDLQKLWENQSDPSTMILLIMIYTGVRIGEILDLQKSDIHLQDRWFYVRQAKTDAGVREVPIAEKVVPFFEYWMQNESDYLLCNKKRKHMNYHQFARNHWSPVVSHLSIAYTPHCTRHTCISMMAEKYVDERIIHQIVGHKGEGVTEAVYTHIDMQTKLNAINLI